MKVVEIYYETNFPLAEKFCFEKIGVKLILEEGEDAKDVLKKARQWVIQQHKAMNPQLYKKLDIPDEVANGHDVDNLIMEDGLPIIQTQTKEKAKPSVVELRKYELAIKNKDEQALAALEKNYLFNQTINETK